MAICKFSKSFQANEMLNFENQKKFDPKFSKLRMIEKILFLTFSKEKHSYSSKFLYKFHIQILFQKLQFIDK